MLRAAVVVCDDCGGIYCGNCAGCLYPVSPRVSYKPKLCVIVAKEQLLEISNGVVELVMAKNRDYADAWQQQGMPGVISRLADKLYRVESLLGKEALVVGEGIEDSLVDAIGYSILGLLYLRSKDNGQEHGKESR